MSPTGATESVTRRIDAALASASERAQNPDSASGDYVHGAYIVSQSHRTNPDLENETLRVRARTTYNWDVCRGWNDRIGRGRYLEAEAAGVRSVRGLTG